MNDLNGMFNFEDYPSGSIPRLYIKMLPLLKQKKGPLKINSPIEYPETVASFYLTAAEKFFGVKYNNEDASFAGKTKISDYLKNVIDTGISVPVFEEWQSSSQKYLFHQKIAKLKTSLQELKTKLEALQGKLTTLRKKL